MRIRDWSSEVCSSALRRGCDDRKTGEAEKIDWVGAILFGGSLLAILLGLGAMEEGGWRSPLAATLVAIGALLGLLGIMRSEEHTSELQSLMRISYAVFCLKKKKKNPK